MNQARCSAWKPLTSCAWHNAPHPKVGVDRQPGSGAGGYTWVIITNLPAKPPTSGSPPLQTWSNYARPRSHRVDPTTSMIWRCRTTNFHSFFLPGSSDECAGERSSRRDRYYDVIVAWNMFRLVQASSRRWMSSIFIGGTHRFFAGLLWSGEERKVWHPFLSTCFLCEVMKSYEFLSFHHASCQPI